ncbi:secondary thiamine-phosphate synthase enzyme YjbQ [Dolichospermum sp. ST_sed1]|nr:secondary thiamine-phosphate synthase enzyme YjbQ [Dolichospermum sp. ST_sed1]MDD1423738.1 secondary thiamine-phosphate synthase enzyme YjbQ [Dolichospermum sp. ST_sed9]MDD1432551.1 secondary thiamine-phosphate synthase enzyme YjbQ [Dolichospermum sp. ST_sed6]MDD1434870.1 secondary thiamine-phosphate synthase enzyme YjbQ [Dolichospermum sp. ST_sed10]MDD1443174.1 secondary thiamine-phosphate synthase enzyme YjbQ [Dolichospermum sp. ST_sed3]MDD1446011.1 secondary thiamine-phosphate synthase e
MTHYQKLLRVSTNGKSFHNITAKIEAIVAASGIETGLCSLFLRHTSASLVIQENADPNVLVDLANFMAKIVPEGNYYIHDDEGPDDMPGHIRTVLTHTSEQIPINSGHLVLGTWQGIYVWEHRQSPNVRAHIPHPPVSQSVISDF